MLEISLARALSAAPGRHPLLRAHAHPHPDRAEHEKECACHIQRLGVVEDEEHRSEAANDGEQVLQPADQPCLHGILAWRRWYRHAPFRVLGRAQARRTPHRLGTKRGLHSHDFVTVMVAFCRVTIIGSSRRVDVSLPEGIPVADLLLDVAGMLDERPDGVPARWALVRVGGHALDPERSLADQGIASGTMLFLRDATEAPPPLAIDDFAQQVAISVDAETGQWTSSMFRWLLAAAGAACLFAAGALVLLAADRGGRTVAGVVGAALSSLAGVALVRLAGRRDFAGLITFAAV